MNIKLFVLLLAISCSVIPSHAGWWRKVKNWGCRLHWSLRATCGVLGDEHLEYLGKLREMDDEAYEKAMEDVADELSNKLPPKQVVNAMKHLEELLAKGQQKKIMGDVNDEDPDFFKLLRDHVDNDDE
ncbi:unnamed protein product [Clavelina lepadiformis]|uniref:Uncharacterized protein n=1 Tax=Clavelina lepadiformis TaxID=159417 RepID=A0ABP0GXE4_CLALP